MGLPRWLPYITRSAWLLYFCHSFNSFPGRHFFGYRSKPKSFANLVLIWHAYVYLYSTISYHNFITIFMYHLFSAHLASAEIGRASPSTPVRKRMCLFCQESNWKDRSMHSSPISKLRIRFPFIWDLSLNGLILNLSFHLYIYIYIFHHLIIWFQIAGHCNSEDRDLLVKLVSTTVKPAHFHVIVDKDIVYVFFGVLISSQLIFVCFIFRLKKSKLVRNCFVACFLTLPNSASQGGHRMPTSSPPL